ncbi:hypothetical protein D3C73_1310410 [compost metagenome]
MLPELLAYIFAAVMELLLQLLRRYRFNQMLLDIGHRIADQLRHEIVRFVCGRLIQGVDEHKQLGCIGFR